jgi:hypothetical protein
MRDERIDEGLCGGCTCRITLWLCIVHTLNTLELLCLWAREEVKQDM